jgi:hypothetical protein
MKHVTRPRTLTALVVILLCATTLALHGHHVGYAAPSALSRATDLQGSPQQTLDVVLLGPFALLDCPGKGTIRVLVPNVPDHMPLRIGYPSTNYQKLAAGEYQLLGVLGSNAPTTFANPVEDAGALTFPTKDVCPKTPNQCEHVCIDMPRPKQFVPWNADPGQVTIPGKDQVPWKKLATALVLRYPVSDLKGIALSSRDDRKPCGPKMPCGLTPETNATEGILALVLAPNSKEDPHHSHARSAFQGLMGLIHMQATVEFPDPADGSKKINEPLIDRVVPKELIDSLAKLKRDSDLNKAGPDNDCESPLVVVTDIKQK